MLLKILKYYYFLFSAIGIRIDSGDLAYLSRVVKETMERVAVKYEMEWFQNMVITASNDINEETILSLNEQGHKITCFGTKTIKLVVENAIPTIDV